MTSEKILHIEEAEYQNNYKIKFKFNDKKEVIVDFEEFLNSSQHPEIKKYLDEDLFKSFVVQDGDISWNNFDLIFPIIDIYENNILHRKRTDTKAS